MTRSKPNQGSETVGDKAWEAFAEVVSGLQERRPTGEGWFEREEAMRRMGVQPTRFRELMRKAIHAGSIERFDGMTRRNGTARATTFYRRIK